MLRLRSLAARRLAVVVLTGSLAGAAGLAMAPSAAADAAPASEANALGVRIDPILQLAGSDARADERDGSGSASAVRVLGASPVPGAAGAQQGNGSSSGAAVDTGATPAGRVRVAPWSAAVASNSRTRHAQSSTALASIVLFNNSLFVDVLRSQSVADHESGRSTASGSSDGVVLGAGGAATIDALHSDASTDGGATSWLVRINGMTIGTHDQLNGICSVAAAPVLSMACLDIVGGVGTDNGASILDGTVLNAVRPGLFLLATTTGSGSATAVFGARDEVNGLPVAHGTPVHGATRGRLPRTGAPTILLVAVALLLLAAGGTALAAAQLRRSPAC